MVCSSCCRYGRIAKHVAAAPYGLDIVMAACCLRDLLTQLADKDVDDLELGFVHSAVKVVEKHFLGQYGPFAQAQQLDDPVFLFGQTHRPIVDQGKAGIEVNHQPPPTPAATAGLQDQAEADPP